MHPSYALINISYLKYNYLNIRNRISNKKIMAVVKANAYGHGMVKVSKFLESLGKNKPDYFSVAFAEEGEELRKTKIKQPILVFEPFTKNQIHLLFKYDLTATVFNKEHIKTILWGLKKYKPKSKKIKIHVKIDTGMNRLGKNINESFQFIKYLNKINNIQIKGVYTHFASSDTKDKSSAYLQLKRFNNLLDLLDEKKISYGLVHTANSGAVLDLPDSYFDMVRPGITLYGYYPSNETSESIKLKPVMSLISKVSSVKMINKGDAVGYGGKYVANRKTKIVSIPFGYADGLSRNLSNKIKVIIKDKLYNQIGLISMDRIMINVNNDNIKVGDKVIILGQDKKNKICAWDWCKKLNTIPYEITCNINERIPRVYK